MSHNSDLKIKLISQKINDIMKNLVPNFNSPNAKIFLNEIQDLSTQLLEIVDPKPPEYDPKLVHEFISYMKSQLFMTDWAGWIAVEEMIDGLELSTKTNLDNEHHKQDL